jgi:hypothetical protein
MPASTQPIRRRRLAGVAATFLGLRGFKRFYSPLQLFQHIELVQDQRDLLRRAHAVEFGLGGSLQEHAASIDRSGGLSSDHILLYFQVVRCRSLGGLLRDPPNHCRSSPLASIANTLENPTFLVTEWLKGIDQRLTGLVGYLAAGITKMPPVITSPSSPLEPIGAIQYE